MDFQLLYIMYMIHTNIKIYFLWLEPTTMYFGSIQVVSFDIESLIFLYCSHMSSKLSSLT
jgi:hypothetical protein